MTIENEQAQLLNSIEIGDLVWAKMPLPESELAYIEPTHRFRPYLVIKKDDESIYAYQASSKKATCLNNFKSYVINQSNKGYDKNSWVNLSVLYKVPCENLLYKMIHLNDHDLSMIDKRLNILKNRGTELRQTLNLPIQYAAGDVITYTDENGKESIYYVFSVEGNKLICYGITYGKKNWRQVVINRKNIYLDFIHQVTLTDLSKVKIIDIANNYEIAVINQIKKEVWSEVTYNPSKKKDYEIGTVFETFQGEIMYLYKYKNAYYGVNLSTYKAFVETVEIKNIDIYKIIDVRDSNCIKEVVRYLYINMNQPPKQIRWLYEETVV